MNKIVILVGPPGSGKSTLAKKAEQDGFVYVNQDSQGADHMAVYDQALREEKNIIVDRMNFNREQRSRYLKPAQRAGYRTEIIVLHQPYSVCLDRIRARQNHETIKDEKAARGALNTFFTKYERPSEDEAETITCIWPEGVKPQAIICDLDGTLCNIDHRLHFVKKPKGEKKDWPSFFYNIHDDQLNPWCADIVEKFSTTVQVVYCSGRPDNYRESTQKWLERHSVDFHKDHLYMRPRSDSREDSIVKEIILDFEILTRFTPYFAIDDRSRVVDMWRRRDIVTLACASGDF